LPGAPSQTRIPIGTSLIEQEALADDFAMVIVHVTADVVAPTRWATVGCATRATLVEVACGHAPGGDEELLLVLVPKLALP
jgi:hypothetical protein